MSQSFKTNYKLKNKKDIDDDDFLTFKSYIDLLGTKYFITLMIGNLSFGNLFFIW